MYYTVNTEEKILLLSSYYSLSANQRVTFTDLINQYPDWNQITAASRFHSLAPLLVKHLTEANLQTKLPPSTWEKIIGSARLQAARRLRIISVFRELSSVFKEKNIEFILLKGLYLADSYYSNPEMRPMQDIDLLIRIKDLDQVVWLMESLSASKIVELQSDFINSFLQHIPPFIYKDVLIEIHTNIIAANEPYSFTPETLWNNTVNIEIQKVNTRVFNPELNLVYLCVHLFRHVLTAKFKLIWFADLMQLLSDSKSFDNVKINVLTRETESEETLKKVFFLLNEFWNFKDRDKILITIEEPDMRDLQNFRKGILRKQNPDEYYTFEAWKRIPGIKNKFRFAIGLTFPSANYMKKKYKFKTPLILIPLYPYNALKVIFKGLKILLFR